MGSAGGGCGGSRVFAELAVAPYKEPISPRLLSLSPDDALTADLRWANGNRRFCHRRIAELFFAGEEVPLRWRAVKSVPGKVSGARVFLGMRMPVDEITEVFDVTPEEVKAVLHFASESFSKAPAFGWNELANGGLIQQAEEAGYDVLLSTGKIAAAVNVASPVNYFEVGIQIN